MKARATVLLLVGLTLLQTRSGRAGPPSPLPGPPAEGMVATASGAPVRGAAVYVVEHGFERGVFRRAESDASGRFRLTAGPREGEALIVAPPGQGLTFVSGSHLQPWQARLQASTELRLQFRDATGAPLHERHVTVFPASDHAALDGFVSEIGFPRLPPELEGRLSGTTDANGHLSLSGLPRGARVSVTVGLPWLPSGHEVAAGLRGSVRLADAAITEVAPVRIALTGTIRGQMTFRRTGAPVADASVMLEGPGYHNDLAVATTDAGGRYAFNGLFPSDYELLPSLPPTLLGDEKTGALPYLALSRTRKGRWLAPGFVNSLQLHPGEQEVGLDFALVRSAAIDAQVLGTGRRPVLAAEVRVEPSGQGRLTGADGRCRLPVPPGLTRVSWSTTRTARKPAHERSFLLSEGEIRQVRFAPAGNGREGDAEVLRALAPGLSLTGPSGQPIQLSSFHGKIVVLDFWFPEEGENSMLQALRHTQAVVRRLQRDDLVALAVDTDDQREPFDRFRTAHPELDAIRFARDDSDRRKTGEGLATARYGVYSWPTRYLILRDGTIARSFDGTQTNDEALLEGAIRTAVDRSSSTGTESSLRYRVDAIGEVNSQLFAINSRGELAGRSGPGRSVPQFWAHGKSISLGSAGSLGTVAAVNDRGECAGSLADPRPYPTESTAVSWRRRTEVPLGLDGARFQFATGINGEGEIVGWAWYEPGRHRAFSWTRGRVSFLAPEAESCAYAVNGRGDVAGELNLRAVLWKDRKAQSLGTLGGARSRALALNSHGQVVGESDLPDGSSHAFLWSRGELVDLGPGSAHGINGRGQVVGTAAVAPAGSPIGGSERPRDHAMLWDRGRGIDLNTLIPAGSGWELLEAVGINDAGQIAGNGLFHGQMRGFRLTPAPGERNRS